MPQMKLTEIGIQSLKAPASGQIDYFDKHLSSFGLRVSSKGTKSFFVMTRVYGKLIRVTLGRHPSLTLKEARAKAGQVIETAAAGNDPREEERDRKEREREAAGHTFEYVAREFMAKYARIRLRPSTIIEYERTLSGSETEHLRKRPISTIGRRDIIAILDGIHARGTTVAADRALAYLRKFFNWSADREYVANPPTDRVRAFLGHTERDRVLSREEIAFVWRAFEREGFYRATAKDEESQSVFAPFLKMVLLSAQRRDEVAQMTWQELQGLDGEDPLWVMPKAPPPPADQRTKNGKPHIVPLSPLAVDVLKSVPRTSSQYVFSTTGETPISGFSRLKTRIDRFIAQMREAEDLPWMAHWQFRDLRRTAATHMNEYLGVEPHIADACLNHISGPAKKGIIGTYNKALYLDERRQAMKKWSNYVMELAR
jgi:integrase